jgi:peptidoglycan/LPS O-acetylase OafA/YrhL
MLLSGFLMSFHYILRRDREPWTNPTTWLIFYIRRYFRISPLYYLVLVPAYLFLGSYTAWRTALHLVFLPSNPAPEMPGLSVEHVLSHLTFAFGLWPRYHASLVIPDWSLSLEMQFYLAFPFLMLLAARIGWIAFSCCASAVYVVANASLLARVFVLPSPLPLCLLWFTIGMVWANAYVDLQNERKGAMFSVAFPAGLSLLSRDVHDILLIGVFCWLLFGEHRLVAGKCASYLRELLSGRVSRFLAAASYSVYLVHLLILIPVAYFVDTRTGMGARSRFAIVFLVTAAASYAIAKPLEGVENLGIAWGKGLSRMFAGRSAHGSKRRPEEAVVRPV